VAVVVASGGKWLPTGESRLRWPMLKPLMLAAGATALAIANLIVFNAGHGLMTFTVSAARSTATLAPISGH